MPIPYDPDVLNRMLKGQSAAPPPAAPQAATATAPARQGPPVKPIPYDRDVVERLIAGENVPKDQYQTNRESPWTKSLLKYAIGKNSSELLNPGIDSAVSAVESWIPESWKQKLGGNYRSYVDATAREFAKLPTNVFDFITSPVGLGVTAANFTPAGPYVDVALGAYQGLQTAQAYKKGYDELKQNGFVSPETFAAAAVNTAMAAGPLIYGAKNLKAQTGGLINYAKGAAAGAGRYKRAVEWLAGSTPGQRMAAEARGTFRHGGAKAYVEYAQSVNSIWDSMQHLEGLNEDVRIDALDRIERAGTDPTTGKRKKSVQATPELQKAADLVTEALDKSWDRIQSKNIGGVAKHFFVNYMPRYFKEYEKENAEQALLGLFNRRPLPGYQEFRNPRTILGPIKEIIDPASPSYRKDLHLVTTNWAVLAAMKLQEMKKFEMALDAARELRDRGQLKTIDSAKNLPNGWGIVDSRIIPKAEIPQGNHIIAPTEVAKAINNYLSPGLGQLASKYLPGAAGKATAWGIESVKTFNNATSRFLVSWSGFHPILSSFLTIANEFSLVPMYALRNRWVQSGKAMARGFAMPYTVWDTYRQGDRLSKHLVDPTQNPHLAKYADALMKGGGRGGIDTEYRSRVMEQWFDRKIAQAKNRKSNIGVQMWRAMKNTNSLVMRKIVPNLKNGAFMRLAEYEMDKMGLNWDKLPLEKQREAFGKAYDSIDNRHGQIVYDNLFIPKMMKDVGFLSMQFMGWTLGTYREGFGAYTDVARQLAKAAIGEKPELTHRTSWMLFGLPMMVGLTNGILHTLLNGKPPDQLKDYVSPRTGRKNADGTDERLSMPWAAYPRTFKAIGLPTVLTPELPRNPQQISKALGGRLSNTIVELWDMFHNNANYEGVELWQTGEPFVSNVARELAYVGERSVPISLQNLMSLQPDSMSAGEHLVTSATGARRASASEMRSDAQNLTIDYASTSYTRGPYSEEKFEKKEASQQLSAQLEQGKIPPEQAEEAVRQAAQDQKITANDAKIILSRSKISKEFSTWHPRGTFGSQFVRLEPEKMFSVWRAATPEEKDQIFTYMAPFVRAKILRSPKDKQTDYAETWNSLIRAYVDEKTKKAQPPEVR